MCSCGTWFKGFKFIFRTVFHLFFLSQEPITQRRDKLAASLLSKQLFRDIQDEVEWVEEKQPIVDSTNIG